MAFLSDPEKARICAETKLIETPHFEPVNDSAILGKTRGAACPAVCCPDLLTMTGRYIRYRIRAATSEA